MVVNIATLIFMVDLPSYPCPSQTCVTYQSQLWYTHDYLTHRAGMQLCSFFLCWTRPSQEWICRALAQRAQSFSCLKISRWIRKLLEVVKNTVGWVLQVTFVVQFCQVWVRT